MSDLPSVTRVISQNCGWNKNQLMRWAWKQGCEGRDFRETRNAAADVGTLCHQMIQSHLTGRLLSIPLVDSDTQAKASAAFDNFLAWTQTVDLQVIDTELPLVSSQHGFTGKVDCIARVQGELSIVDWKTTRGIYPEALLQVSAYGQLWNENRPLEPLTGFYLLRLDRDGLGFQPHHFAELSQAFDAFLHLLEIHKLHEELKGLK